MTLRFSPKAAARGAWLLIGLFAATVAAKAARIEVTTPKDDGRPAVVFVSGEFVLADFDSFRQKTEGLAKAIVVFVSDGGNLAAGIDIGVMIRLKGYAALVPDGSRCASACALAWLGGVPRYMGPTAKIGFHAAYVVNRGVPETNAIGNALVGAYLNRIGLSDRAVVYITKAAPREITWLSLADAARVGIDVSPAALQTALQVASQTASQPAPPAPPPPPPPAPKALGDAQAVAAPEPGTPDRGLYCSAEADKRDLHGPERRRFRDRCKRGTDGG